MFSFCRYTCVYLACKVDEFNVSIMQFVSNLPMGADREKTADIILSHELLLMRKLNYNLTIHLPYRPVEGQLLDIKVRLLCLLAKLPGLLFRMVDMYIIFIVIVFL